MGIGARRQRNNMRNIILALAVAIPGSASAMTMTSGGGVSATSTTTMAGLVVTGNADGVLVSTSANGVVGTVKTFPSYLFLNGNTGNVGVGTTNPGSKLWISSGTLNIDGNVANSILTSGNVGIGPSAGNPVAAMESIYSSAAGAEMLSLVKHGDTNRNAITFRDDSVTLLAQIDTTLQGAVEFMRFGHMYNSGAQTSDLLTIAGSGNVGIGVTNPTALLQAGIAQIAGPTISTVTNCGALPSFAGPPVGADITVGGTPSTTCSISWTPAFKTNGVCQWFDGTTAHVLSTVATGVASSTATFAALTGADDLMVRCTGY